MNNILDALANIINSHGYLAPIIALIAGILTSFTPCSLSSIPLIIGYVGGKDISNPKKAFSLSLVFSIGMAATFTTLGVIASIVGKMMYHMDHFWYIILRYINDNDGTTNFWFDYNYKTNIFNNKK